MEVQTGTEVPIKGTRSNLEKADFVLLKLRRSLKNLVKFYIYNSIHHRIYLGAKLGRLNLTQLTDY